MAEFGKGQKLFKCRGVDLSHEPDQLPPEKFAILKNVRSYLAGKLQPRKGFQLFNGTGVVVAGKSPVHSIRRISNSSDGTNALVFGVGDTLAVAASGTLPATSVATGLSGDPLSLVAYRPTESPNPWVFVGDENSVRKVSIGGLLHQVGLPSPLAPPTVDDPTHYDGCVRWRLIDKMGTITDWYNDGSTSAVSTIAGSRVSTTITSIIYDDPDTSDFRRWCCVRPASMAGIIPNCLLTYSTVQFVVTETFSATSSFIQVESIIYDSGSAGLCTIQLNAGVDSIRRNALVLINAAGPYRVLHAGRGQDDRTYIRVNTGATTHSAGQSVQGVASFRANIAPDPFSVYPAAGGTISDVGLETTTNASFKGETFVEHRNMAVNGLLLGIDGSDTYIATSNPRGVTPDDFITLLFWMDKPARFTEGKIVIDINGGVARFERNYFMKPFRASDITPILEGQQAAVDVEREIARRRRMLVQARPYFDDDFMGGPQTRIDYDPGTNRPAQSVTGRTPDRGPYEPPDDPDISIPIDASGREQWMALTFRFGEMIRVGTDESRTFSSIEAIRLYFTVTDAVKIRFSSFFIWGGFPMETTDDRAPYYYRYRGRCSSTGARSNFSPPSDPFLTNRRPAWLTLPQHPTTECDKLDIERWGGSLADVPGNDGWRYIGTVANGASATFWDTLSDEAIDANLGSSEGNKNAQPFTVLGAPISGTIIKGAGTALEANAGTFSLDLAMGNTIRVGGKVATIRNVSSDGSRCHLFESIGALGAVTFEISAPRYVGQICPMWIEWNNTLFAWGNKRQPGMLFYCNAGTESTRERNWIEVANPSEPIQNCIIKDGRLFLFTTKRMFQVIDQTGAGGLQVYAVPEVTGAPGLYSRWALCSGPKIWYLDSNLRVRETDGGEGVDITDDLTPLFPTSGEPGTDTRGISALVLAGTENVTRFSFDGRFLHITYFNGSSAIRQLTYDTAPESRGWYPDVTTPGMHVYYPLEGKQQSLIAVGGDDGKLYKIGGKTDNGVAIDWLIRTVSENVGDPRTEKVWGDVALGVDTGGETITASVGFDRHSATVVPVPSSISDATTKPVILDLNSGDGRNALDISLELSGSVATTEAPVLHWWEPTWINRPEDTVKRATDNDPLGRLLPKYLQGCTIHADSENAVKTIQVLGDNDVLIATPTLQHNGLQTSSFSWEPVITRVARLRPTDSNRWKNVIVEWHWSPEPEIATLWKIQPTGFGLPGYKHVKQVEIMYACATTVTMTVTLDGVDYVYTLPATGGGSTRDRQRVILQARKFRLVGFAFSAAAPGLRLYAKDCSVYVKAHGSNGAYEVVRPFGDVHAEPGAII